MSFKIVLTPENMIIAVILVGIFGASIVLGVDPQGVLLRIIVGVTSSIVLGWYLKRHSRDKPRQEHP